MDQSQINSINSSISSYNRAASSYDSTAATAQKAINDLDGQIAHKREQLRIATEEVQPKFQPLSQAKTDLDTQLGTMADQLNTAMVGDDGARGQIKNLDSTFDGHISDASQALATLIANLQAEIQSLVDEFNRQVTIRDNARASAASCRSSAASLSRQLANAS